MLTGGASYHSDVHPYRLRGERLFALGESNSEDTFPILAKCTSNHIYFCNTWYTILFQCGQKVVLLFPLNEKVSLSRRDKVPDLKCNNSYTSFTQASYFFSTKA